MQVATPAKLRRHVPLVLCALVATISTGCSSSNSSSKAGITPTYDKTSGRLTELAYDSNHNGTVDTWTEMNGPRPLRSRIDRNEDGRIDRWEYYDEHGQLAKVGFSRRDEGKPDAWAFVGADGKTRRIEISSVADETKIDRWEQYDQDELASAEEDTNHDGRVDTWETFEGGALATVSFDERGAGKATRRLTYADGVLVAIETEPDDSGKFKTRVSVKPD